MGEGLDFSGVDMDALAAEAMQWENLDEAGIKSEVEALAGRLNAAAKLLDEMVYRNDYDKTSDALYDIWMYDLGPSGWVQMFLTANKNALSPYVAKPGRPSWYNAATPDEQRAFDVALGYYKDCTLMVKATNALRDVMMLYPLTTAFKYMRLTVNLDEAGLGEEWFQNVNDDVRETCGLINKSWTAMEKLALRANTYYKNQDLSMSMSETIKEYRMARRGDYKTMFEAVKLDKRFYWYNNGTITAKPVVLAYMRIIDEYTAQIAGLGNIEEDLNKSKERILKVSDAEHPCYAKCTMGASITLMDAINTLKQRYWQFNEAAINVYTCYKERSWDQPYLFMRQIPSYDEIKGTYGLTKPSGDPLKDGTKYYDLYQAMAKALTAHCLEFTTKHGAPEFTD